MVSETGAEVIQGELDYSVPLSREQRKSLGKWLAREIGAYTNSVARRLRNVEEWNNDVELMPADEAIKPWETASTVRAPYTRLAVGQHTSRLNEALYAFKPPWTAVPTESPVETSRLRVIEESVYNKMEQAGMRIMARRTHKELNISGNCLVRASWEQRTVKVPVEQVDIDEATMQALTEGGVAPDEALMLSVEADREGRPVRKLGWEVKVLKDGLSLKHIPFRDMVVLPPDAVWRDEIWALGERMTLRGSDLLHGVESKRYDKETVEQLLQLGSDSAREDMGEYLEVAALDPYQRPSGTDSRFEARRNNVYDVVQISVFSDIDGDGDDEWYLIVYHPATESVIGCQYSPYQHGKSCYVPYGYIDRPGHFLCRSVAEELASMNDAGTMALNAFYGLVDWLQNGATSWFYDSTSGFRPDSVRIGPGEQIPVDNINGIKEFPLPSSLPNALQALASMMDQLKVWSELISATSNPSLGRETESRTTLGEVQAVMSAGNAIFRDYAEAVLVSHAEVADLCRELLIQYSPNGEIGYPAQQSVDPATGAPVAEVPQVAGDGSFGVQMAQVPSEGTEFAVIPAQVLDVPVRFVPAGMAAFSDPNSRIQQAMLLLQTLGQHPLTAQNMELQAQLLADFVQATGVPGADSYGNMIRQSVVQMQQQMMMQQAMAQAQQEQAMGQQQDQHSAMMDQSDRENSRADAMAMMQMEKMGAEADKIRAEAKVAGKVKK